MSLLVGVNPGHRSESVLQLAAMLARSLRTDLVVAAVVPRTWSPSAIPSSVASSTWMSARCDLSPRINSGELCIQEFSERVSRMPIIRIGKLSG